MFKHIVILLIFFFTINLAHCQVDSFEMNTFKRAEKARKWRYKQKPMFSNSKRKIKNSKGIRPFYVKQKKRYNFGWR